jgi:hypothetical protein
MGRRSEVCVICGEEKTIVSAQRCAACYMGQRRRDDAAGLENLWAPPERHDVERRKYQRRARKALSALRNSLEELESPPYLSAEAIKLIRVTIQPALVLSARSLCSEETESEDSWAGGSHAVDPVPDSRPKNGHEELPGQQPENTRPAADDASTELTEPHSADDTGQSS